MLKETLRAVKRLEEVRLDVSVPTDEEGYLDRECPNSDCEFVFKVYLDDWEREDNGDSAFCPRCRHEADGNHWWTKAQAEYLNQIATRHVNLTIRKGLQIDARNFSHRQRRNSLISMKMKVSPYRDHPVEKVRAAELMQQKFECTRCNARYASVGIAFFCPLCGLDDTERAFHSSIETTRTLMGRVSTLRTMLSTEFGDDAAADMARTIVEDSMGRLVGGFERYCEVMFAKVQTASGITVKGGVFQRLDDASALWAQVGKPAYDTVLSASEWKLLKLLYQRRHLLVHNAGVVDQRYLDRSGDTKYGISQRVVVDVKDVQALAELLGRLASTR